MFLAHLRRWIYSSNCNRFGCSAKALFAKGFFKTFQILKDSIQVHKKTTIRKDRLLSRSFLWSLTLLNKRKQNCFIAFDHLCMDYCIRINPHKRRNVISYFPSNQFPLRRPVPNQRKHSHTYILFNIHPVLREAQAYHPFYHTGDTNSSNCARTVSTKLPHHTKPSS